MKKLIAIIAMLFITSVGESQLNLDSLASKDSSMHRFVNEWLGSKYRAGGNNKEGVDCSGFSRILYSTIYNQEIPRTAKEQYNHSLRIKKNNLQLGDLIFFRSKYSPTGWHVAVYLYDGYFVHSGNRHTGVCVGNLQTPYYTRNYKGAGRFKIHTINKTILYNQFRDYTDWLEKQEQNKDTYE